MPLSREEWERRYKAQIIKVLTNPLNLGDVWTQQEEEEAAREELSAVAFEDLYRGFEDDPEGSANESLSYWD